jgi:MFS family permease
MLYNHPTLLFSGDNVQNHSLIVALKNLRGNPRGCVYPEPLWGIPFNLYAPYVSIYMLAIGLSEKEIGSILSISWGFQIVFALLGGVVTDKLGRRLTTLLFDIMSWSVPALISAVAQNYWYFLVAGIVNSVWRVTHVSWYCLLVEDAEPEQLVDIFSWIYIANLIVGFIAPLAGFFIENYSLIPTMRGLYFFAAFMFTLKAFVTYAMTDETAQGKIRLHETRGQSPLSVLSEYRHVLRDLLNSPRTLYTAGIMLVVSITNLISGSFWSIIVTEKLKIPAANLAYFPFVRTAIMLFFFFVVIPRIGKLHFKIPMTVGFLGFVASQILLITAPVQGYAFLFAGVFLEACSIATVNPLVEQLTVLSIDAKERARIQSIINMGVILLTSPFGWIAGNLSSLNKNLPFILNIALFAIGAALAFVSGQRSQNQSAAESMPA